LFEDTLVSSIKKSKIESVVNNTFNRLAKRILNETNLSFIPDLMETKLRCYILETLETELEENRQWMKKKLI
jgi:hypothetical protein